LALIFGRLPDKRVCLVVDKGQYKDGLKAYTSSFYETGFSVPISSINPRTAYAQAMQIAQGLKDAESAARAAHEDGARGKRPKPQALPHGTRDTGDKRPLHKEAPELGSESGGFYLAFG